jgi:hypothetical protein
MTAHAHPAIPLWVFGVLLLLLMLGWRQSRTRTVRPGAVVAAAVGMGLFSFLGVTSAFGPSPAALLAWAAGMALAIGTGGCWAAPRGLTLDTHGRGVQVPGSWLPMALLMGVFLGKFALGWARGVGSPIVDDAAFGLGMSLLFGLLSGGFSVRAIAIQRFAGAAASPAPVAA